MTAILELLNINIIGEKEMETLFANRQRLIYMKQFALISKQKR